MPAITNIRGFVSKRKGRYWILWDEDGRQYEQDFASNVLAMAFVRGLNRAAAQTIVADGFFAATEGDGYTIIFYNEAGGEVARMNAAPGKDGYEAGTKWLQKFKRCGFEIWKDGTPIIKAGNRSKV